ncbi:MAG: RagB/SusD family nutrient uptake outer membrane protein [Chitinophagaceae bacterium]|nr:RagB/SusD family nutrient uptake outer membrane protein [Chitinophagaceae bacterium]
MKMFKYKLLSLSLIVLFFSSSCKKDFLDTFPTNGVATTEATATTKNGYAALNGIHRIMYVQYDQQGQAGEGSNNIFRDLMGEDIVYPLANGSTGLIGFMQWVTHRNVNSADLRYVYRYYYRIISNANVLINGIDKAAGPDADKKIIKGQSLAYRAWAHYQLVQLWGKRYDAATKPNSQLGVPLLSINVLDGQPRATVEEVYTIINKDLDSAASLLTGYSRSGTAAKSNFNVNVVKGMKARVALTQQDWETAATNAIAARAGFALMDTAAYKSGFNNIDNQEWIWGSRQIDDHNTFFFSYFAYISANFNSTVLRTQPRAINATLYNAIPSSDIRKRMWDLTGATVPIPPGGARVAYQNKKFLAKSDALSVGDVPYMRAAEMYLIEAEARARQGQNTAAQTALFTLAKNRNLNYVQSTATGQALIDEIFFHRRIELWGEGFRFTDLKRTNSPMNRAGIPNHLPALIMVTTIPADDKQWEWLFPQDELNSNKALTQNPL